jgi:hypothetical protein
MSTNTVRVLAVWTVTYDVIQDHGHIIRNLSLSTVAETAGEAIAETLVFLSGVVKGGHAAVSGAAIRRSDPLNSDVIDQSITDSVVGLVDLQA